MDAVSMPDPYYDCDGITIYHGDSREIAPLLDFDGLVLADGPHGIKLRNGTRRRTGLVQRGRRTAMQHDYADVAGDDRPFDPRWMLDVGKAHIVWGANHFASRLPDSDGWLVWDKKRPNELDQSRCELAWTDVVKGTRFFAHLWNGLCRATEIGHGNFVHPMQKPIVLMEWCLSLRWTRDYTEILDPYMGSGPVLLAALRQGKRAIGIEIEEYYCAVAVERIERERARLGKVEPESAVVGQQIGLFACP